MERTVGPSLPPLLSWVCVVLRSMTPIKSCSSVSPGGGGGGGGGSLLMRVRTRTPTLNPDNFNSALAVTGADVYPLFFFQQL